MFKIPDLKPVPLRAGKPLEVDKPLPAAELPNLATPHYRLLIGAGAGFMVLGFVFLAAYVVMKNVSTKTTPDTQVVEIDADAPLPPEPSSAPVVATPEATPTPEPTPAPAPAPTPVPTKAPAPKPAPTPAPTPTPVPTPAPTTYAVSYTGSNCYTPSELTIKAGDIVKFTNNSNSRDMWPASDPHPSHTEYPGFDAGQALDKGESYSFTFTKKGSWDFHDHLRTSCDGEITVN